MSGPGRGSECVRIQICARTPSLGDSALVLDFVKIATNRYLVRVFRVCSQITFQIVISRFRLSIPDTSLYIYRGTYLQEPVVLLIPYSVNA